MSDWDTTVVARGRPCDEIVVEIVAVMRFCNEIVAVLRYRNEIV